MSSWSPSRTLRRWAIFGALAVLRIFRKLVSRSDETYKLLFTPGFEGFRWRVGRWRAWLALEHARREVPAYRAFLAEQGGTGVRLDGLDPDFSGVPATDKETYVRRYSIEERCRGGRIPPAGVVIDESSGTSGAANNWVRGPEERKEVKQALQVAFHHLLGKEPVFFLNAFALGPWATGMNVSMSLVDVAILKSVGPDVGKIEATLRTFGPKYKYVIAGYPPFLKTLVDRADVDWSAYDLLALFGGEGMSEGMRDYLLSKGFKRAYGSYGASDLEINIGVESDFTIGLRRLLARDEEIASRLLRREHGVLPMVFQYNPIDYCIETNDAGELLVTLNRTRNTSPKIRYNIHDLGHVLRMPELERILAEHGIGLSNLDDARTDLPLLFLYGRADAAVAYYGAKVTPADVEEVIFAMPELAARVNSFALVVEEDERADKRLTIALELCEGTDPSADGYEPLRHEVIERLKAGNQDFREAARFMPPKALPRLELHPYGQGPFARNDIRLKKHYVQTR
jgi:phenylacetate-CoA ligase